VKPSATNRAEVTPFSEERATSIGFPMVPKLARILAAIETAPPIDRAMSASSKPSSFAAVTAEPKVPIVPLLSYALAKLYRRDGVLTVAGGPHAKSFPDDCARFFDLTVKECDRALIADILGRRFDHRRFEQRLGQYAELISRSERIPVLSVETT